MTYYPVAGAEANPLLTLLFGILIGSIFATVGVAGAALTGLFQVFIGVSTGIRPTNVLVTSVSPLMGVYIYWKERRIAPPMVVFLIGGIFLGAVFGSYTSILFFGRAESKFYVIALGIIAALTGAYLLIETLPKLREKRKKLAAMSKNFEDKIKELKKTQRWKELRFSNYKTIKITPGEYAFSFAGEELRFSPPLVFAAGAVIAFIASFFGIGGGNLYLFFLAGIFGLPMYLAVGTAIAAVLFTSFWTMLNYFYHGIFVDWLLAANLAAGVIIGSYFGPKYSKFVPEVWLRRFAGVALLFAGYWLCIW